MIPPISAFQIDRITGMRHWCPEGQLHLKRFWNTLNCSEGRRSQDHSGGRDKEDRGLKPSQANS
jgi:hypothetical protein